MDNWRMMMYLGTPVMPDLNALIATGLYINDLSLHDFSRYTLETIPIKSQKKMNKKKKNKCNTLKIET